jgi:hypothetical protein
MIHHVDHVYEIVFFSLLIIPLAIILLPKVDQFLKSCILRNKIKSQDLVRELKDMEHKRSSLKSELTKVRDRHSKLPNYLADFEQLAQQQCEARNMDLQNQFQQQITRALDVYSGNQKEGALRASFATFRKYFADSMETKVSFNRVLDSVGGVLVKDKDK